VEGGAGAGEAVARALEAQEVSCVRASAGAAPAWDDFAAVVLVRVDPGALGGRGAELEAYVERGGGLLVVAGPEESAAWERDPLGRILPMNFRNPDPPSPEPGPKIGNPAPSDEAPRVLLVLAIDRSGSMLGEKMLQAKEAALASARTLGEGDVVAVLAFDEEAHWVVEPTAATAAATLEDLVSRLQAGGGTDVHAALVALADRLVGLKIPVRHVVLMTDGQTPTADFQAQVEKLAADGVTVSTVGLGAEFDGALLANIAAWGHGRFYFTERPGEIPRIFTAEARRAAAGAPAPRARPSPTPGPAPTRAPEFLPVVPVQADPSLEGLDAWPDAGGACGHEPRPGARLLLRAGQRPLLATARVSLGRVAAFAAPLDGARGAKWTAWERFPRFAAQTARVLMRPEAAGPSIQVAAEGDRRRVTVRAPGSAEIRATLDGVPLPLLPRAGGAWEALLPPGGFPSLRRLDAATAEGHAAAAVAWAFPVELAPRPVAPLPFPDATPAALEGRPSATRIRRDERYLWALAAALLLIVVEVWLRRGRP
ncbi:MAG: VWA domain-containing protein, partial [Planctomycetes bacterium]|nr:VWA domain-containing protein [Planctomycetota bacterium]